MAMLPTGIVAFLMTDVERSTQRWNESGDAMEAAIGALDADITATVEAHGGSLVKARGEGDSHFAAFSRASDAVVAAAEVQRRRDDRVSVRGCVLIGEAQPRGDDYLGAIVNHGARIRSAAHGGQVIVTRPVVDVASVQSDGLTFRPLGTHRVHDVPEPIELFQLCGAGLRASFPPLNTAAFDASTLMAVVMIDEVDSKRRLSTSDEQLLTWQRDIIRSLREASDRHDGRFLKLIGDGCVVGFEDPRAAKAFADGLPDNFRIGIALGLVEIVEGEMVGRPLFEAHALMRSAEPGQPRCGEVLETILAGAAGSGS
jgi:class 3 adenylate cyclase